MATGDPTTRRFSAGHIFFSHGDRPDCAYRILSGRAEIEVERYGAWFPIRPLHPGEVFGLSALIAGCLRVERVRATKEIEVRIIEQPEIAEELAAMNGFMRHYIQMITKRAHARMGRVARPERKSGKAAPQT